MKLERNLAEELVDEYNKYITKDLDEEKEVCIPMVQEAEDIPDHGRAKIFLEDLEAMGVLKKGEGKRMWHGKSITHWWTKVAE